MKYLRSIRGKFEKHHFDLLIDKGINHSATNSKKTKYPMRASFQMVEDEIYFELIEYFKDAKDFSDQRKIVTFDEEELKSYKYFFLRGIVPEIKERPYERVTCNDCKRDDSKSPYYNHYKEEPVLAAKDLFVWSPSFNPTFITDHRRFMLLNDRFDLKSKPIYYGKDKFQSQNYLAIDIPVSSSALDFTDSVYGEVFSNCNTCNSIFYKDTLGLFPGFKENQEFDICLTQEKFVPWFRCIIVSNDFVKFLVDFGMLTWGPYHLIPVKGSEKALS